LRAFLGFVGVRFLGMSYLFHLFLLEIRVNVRLEFVAVRRASPRETFPSFSAKRDRVGCTVLR
jgi:hypothetical protein